MLIPYEYIFSRIYFALAISIGFAIATAAIRPNKRSEDNALSLTAQIIIIMALLCCLLIHVSAQSPRIALERNPACYFRCKCAAAFTAYPPPATSSLLLRTMVHLGFSWFGVTIYIPFPRKHSKTNLRSPSPDAVLADHPQRRRD